MFCFMRPVTDADVTQLEKKVRQNMDMVVVKKRRLAQKQAEMARKCVGNKCFATIFLTICVKPMMIRQIVPPTVAYSDESCILFHRR